MRNFLFGGSSLCYENLDLSHRSLFLKKKMVRYVILSWLGNRFGVFFPAKIEKCDLEIDAQDINSCQIVCSFQMQIYIKKNQCRLCNWSKRICKMILKRELTRLTESVWSIVKEGNIELISGLSSPFPFFKKQATMKMVRWFCETANWSQEFLLGNLANFVLICCMKLCKVRLWTAHIHISCHWVKMRFFYLFKHGGLLQVITDDLEVTTWKTQHDHQ